MNYIETGKKEGAKVAIGGERYGDTHDSGYFIQPTILVESKPHMRVVQEEIFGPVIVVGKFTTEAEAIELANNSSYGLSSAVITESVNRAIRVSGQLEAGTVFVRSFLVVLFCDEYILIEHLPGQHRVPPSSANAIRWCEAVRVWQGSRRGGSG